MSPSDLRSRLAASLAGRYTIERELGRGGMAVVYLATDVRHSREVALKVLRPELDVLSGTAAFLREIAVTAQLQHPHIVPLLDSGDADGLPYYVTRYVAGPSLKAVIADTKQLDIESAVLLAREVADALDHAHRHGVLHRDVKPANILLEDGHAVVADFGIARAIAAGRVDGDETFQAGYGTPAYMSPEQSAGETTQDERSDLYSLGCVLYEMLAGEPPFTGPNPSSVIRQHLSAPAPPISLIRPATPPPVAAAIARTLEKSPADRFRTASEFSSALGSNGEARWMDRGGRQLLAAAGAWAIGAVMIAGLEHAIDRFTDAEAASIPGPAPYTIVAGVEGTAPAELRDAVQSLVAVRVDQSGVLRTVPMDHIERGLELAGLPDTARIDLQISRDLAFRGAIRTVIVPFVHQIGDAFAISVRVLNADDGDVIVAKTGVAANADQVIVTVEDVVDSVRAALGERRDAISANRPLVEVATFSLPAFRKYVEAQDHFRRLDLRGCIAAGNEAIQRDSQFASAWLLIGLCYGNAYVRDSAIAATSRATALRHRLTDVQQLNLEGVVSAWNGNSANALAAFDRAARVDPGYHHNRAVILSDHFGLYDEAADAHARSREASPFGPSALAYLNGARTFMAQGKFAEAESLDRLRPGKDRGTGIEFGLAAGRHEWDELARSALNHASHPASTHGRRVNAAVAFASANAVRGRLDDGLAILRRSIDSATGRADGLETLEWFLWTVREVTGGSDSVPMPAARSQLGRAIWAASRGDSADAFRLMDAARASMPGRPIDALKREALASALIARSRGRHREVVALLAPDRSDWFQVERWWFLANSYHELGVSDSAAAYLQRLTAAEGLMGEGNLMVRGIAYPFAEFRLGLHYDDRGDVQRARRHYRAFLQTFTDPDSRYLWMLEHARRGMSQSPAERKGVR